MRNGLCVLPWLAFVVASCTADSPQDTARQSTLQPIQQPSLETPDATVKKFLEWYEQNRDKLYNIPVVPASVDGDTANIYRVDFKVAEKYLALLQSNGLLSAAYLADEMTRIKRADSTMQASPQTDGPPPGFDADRVVFSQDPEADFEKLKRTTPSTAVNGNMARVYFSQLPKPEDMREGADLEFLLVRHQGKWLIQKIRPVFTD